MPLLLSRYLLGDLVPSFGIGLLAFTMVLLMEKVMRIVEWVVRKGVSIGDVAKIFGCLLPSFFVFTLPSALLLGVLLTFSRIYADNELYALKASGVSLYGLLPTVYAFAVFVSAVSFFLTGWAAPQSARTLQSILYSMATQNLFVGLKERVFFEELPGFVLYVENVVPEQNTVKGVFIADQRLAHREAPVYYFAEEGEVHGNPETGTVGLFLKNGAIHRLQRPEEGVYQIVRFERYSVKVNVGAMLMPSTGRGRTQLMEELTLPELSKQIQDGDYGEKDARKFQLNYHQRFAFPFAALVFCTLGVPLALLSRHAVRYTGFSLSIGVMLLFFVLMQVGSGLTFAGYLPAVLGAWLPNLVLGSMGVYLTWRKAEEKPLKLLDAYAQLVRDIQEAVQRRLHARP
jgi:lipopolysaccharide export system permease protein